MTMAEKDVTDEMEQFETELLELADKQQIHDCVYRYGRGIDRHDEAILRTVFHADSVDIHGDVTLSRDDFIPWANQWHENVAVSHQHNMTTHFSDIDGDDAHAVTYVIFCLCRKDGVTIQVGGGRYIDRLQRRDGVWQILIRRITIDWRFNEDRSTATSLGGHQRGTWDRSDPSYAFVEAL